MSDNPQEPKDNQAPEEGGWHAPIAPNPWQPVEREEEPSAGWVKMPAFPDDIGEEPEVAGSWHLPRPEDTQLQVGDEVEVNTKKQASVGYVEVDAPKQQRPEDIIQELLQEQKRKSAPRPEDFMLESSGDADSSAGDTGADGDSDSGDGQTMPTRPEDAIIAMMDADEDVTMVADPSDLDAVLEDEGDVDANLGALSMMGDGEGVSSEFEALNKMATDAPEGVLGFSTEDDFTRDISPTQALMYADEDETTLPVDTNTAAQDPAEYARQQAMKYMQGGEDSAQPADAGADADSNLAVNDPAEYARQQAMKYAQGGDDSGFGAGDSSFGAPVQQQQPAQQQLTPQQQALAQKFRETKQQVQILRARYQQGQMSYEELQNQLRALTVLDDNQQWWMIGVESDAWYRFDNASQQWVEDTPPVPLTGGAPLTATGELNPDDVIAGSLPYLPQDGGANEYSSTGDPYATLGFSDQYDPSGQSGTPVPNPNQPQVDPNMTQVGNSWDADYLQGGEPTVQNMGAVDAATIQSMNTVPSSGNIGSLVDNTYDDAYSDGAPDYTFNDQAADGGIYEEYRERERSSATRIILIAVIALFVLGVVGAIAAFGGITVWYNGQVEPYAGAIAALADYEPDFQTARILDANGDLIIELNSPDGGARDTIPLEDMSPYLVHAVLSTENRTFYNDPGYDIQRILGAFLQNLGSGEIESGASTITQQVARNLILQDQEVTAERKIREILVAMEIARTYDKNFILELYMNEIFFGNQSYGVEAASQFYFDKPASDVNMAEAALLASLIRAPAANDPVVNREQAKAAMRNSIGAMLEAGCLQFQFGEWAQSGEPFCITTDTLVDFNGSQARLVSVNDDGTYGGLLAVQLAQVETRPFRPREFDLEHPHFVNYVLGQLEQQFGSDAIFQRGFTVYTTLIPRVQDDAEAGLSAQVDALVNNGVNTGAVMVTDPTTGAIRAMVGSPDFSDESIDGQVDNTRTYQQPGSSIKPIVYATALEGGANGYLTPSSILWDVPSQYGNYTPRNFDRQFYGPVSVRQALQNSLNVATVKAIDFVGTEEYIEMAGRMQLNFPDGSQFGLPSALGANEVRLIDMMKAYGIVANDGVYVPLYAIERITEEIDGQTAEVPMPERPEPTRAITPQLAYLLQNILSDDPSRAQTFGVNSNLTLANAGIPTQGYVGAKTGTSSGANDNSGNPADLWTMGFTYNTVVGVWLGTWDNSPIVGATGFTASAPLWNRVMRTAITGRAPAPFDNPGGVVQNTVCRETGTLAGDDCPTRITEIYVQQQPPPPASQGFVRNVNVDSWTGLLANEWCPENVVSRTVAAINDPFAVQWLNTTAAGQSYAQRINLPLPLQAAPEQACQQGQQLPSVRLINPSDGQTLSGEFILTGQVSAPNFNRYDLEYASVANPEAFNAISSSTQQVPTAGNEIGRWDTRNVPNGEYIVRLAAYSANGGNIIRTARVRIENIQPTATPTPIQPTAIPITPIQPIDPVNPVNTPIPFDDLNPTPTATLAF
jgi:membrane peptidoglycan carboxypeptidase